MASISEPGPRELKGLCSTSFFHFQDPFGEKRGHFDYQSLLVRLQGIRLKVQEKHQQENPDIDSESSSSETETDNQGSIKA